MADKEIEELYCASQAEWAQWLHRHHAGSPGVWLRHAKKGAAAPSVSHDEALEVALCFGWIDGQSRSANAGYWLQRWTPRGNRSIWSQINRDKALRYVEEGKMQPSGLAEIERARKDGRWDAAYAPASAATVPPDLQTAFDANPKAAAFFATLSSQNRYSVLFRIHGAKKPETRARRIGQFVEMLARHETIHPQSARKA